MEARTPVRAEKKGKKEGHAGGAPVGTNPLERVGPIMGRRERVGGATIARRPRSAAQAQRLAAWMQKSAFVAGGEGRGALAVALLEGVGEVGDALETDAVGDLSHRAGAGPQELLGPLEAERPDEAGGRLAGQGA